MKYSIENAEKIAEKNSDTFEIPGIYERKNLKVRDVVKLIFNQSGRMPERMWVKVIGVAGDEYVGELDNDPVFIDCIKHGDIVVFKPENIINIY